jgi:hypothetical protein
LSSVSSRKCKWYSRLSVLEVVEEDVETLGLNTVVLDDDTGATNDLAGVALAVELAQTSPGTEDLRVSNLDEVDFVLGTEGLNELDVLGLSAGLDEDTEVSLALIEGLGALAEATGEAVVNESVLQDLLMKQIRSLGSYSMKCDTHLESILNRELALGRLGGHLDGGVDLNIISSVRHPAPRISPASSPTAASSTYLCNFEVKNLGCLLPLGKGIRFNLTSTISPLQAPLGKIRTAASVAGRVEHASLYDELDISDGELARSRHRI